MNTGEQLWERFCKDAGVKDPQSLKVSRDKETFLLGAMLTLELINYLLANNRLNPEVVEHLHQEIGQAIRPEKMN